MIFKKGIATILSTATLLTAVSPCAFAEGNSKEETTKSMSTTGKVILAGAGAIGLAALGGIIYHVVKNSHVKVETLKGKPIYEKYMELQKAVVSGKCEKVKNLLNTNKELDINAIYSTTLATLLHKAAWKNDVTMCNILIDRGADINAENDNGETPLHLAAYNGYTKICKLLIDKGANVNAKQWCGGMTPLHRAVCRKHFKTCEVLIKNNANVNIRANSGETPLEESISNNNKKMCGLLIKNGADVNLRNNQGDTPLHKAASHNRYDICKLLIDNGADINATDKYGFTPLDHWFWTYSSSISYAFGTDLDKKETRKLLNEYGAKHGNELK